MEMLFVAPHAISGMATTTDILSSMRDGHCSASLYNTTADLLATQNMYESTTGTVPSQPTQNDEKPRHKGGLKLPSCAACHKPKVLDDGDKEEIRRH